jgi:hypothetical protein
MGGSDTDYSYWLWILQTMKHRWFPKHQTKKSHSRLGIRKHSLQLVSTGPCTSQAHSFPVSSFPTLHRPTASSCNIRNRERHSKLWGRSQCPSGVFMLLLNITFAYHQINAKCLSDPPERCSVSPHSSSKRCLSKKQ